MGRNKRFGRMMRQKRVSCGMSIEVLSKKTGINATKLGNIERGSIVPPDKDEFEKIRDALNFDDENERIMFALLAGDGRDEICADVVKDILAIVLD